MSELPSNNISQRLFYKLMPPCKENSTKPCCIRDQELQTFYKKAPKNLWNTTTNYEGGPPFDNCTDDAFFKQCMISQYYNYLSKNNTLGPY